MADVKLELAPYVSPTDTMAKISAPGGTANYDLMVSLTEFVKGPVLGASPGDEKALALDLGKIPNSKKLMPLFQDEIVVRDSGGRPEQWAGRFDEQLPRPVGAPRKLPQRRLEHPQQRGEGGHRPPAPAEADLQPGFRLMAVGAQTIISTRGRRQRGE